MLATDNRTYIEDVHFETAEELLKSISYGGDLYKIMDGAFIFKFKLYCTGRIVQP